MPIAWLLSGGWKYAVMGLLALAWGIQTLRLDGLESGIAKAEKVATEAARQQEAKNASTAQEIEVAHNERAKAIDDAFNADRQLARTRGLYIRVKSDLSKSAANPGGTSDGAVEARLSDGDGEFLETFARDCAQDQNIAISGHQWAGKVGKP